MLTKLWATIHATGEAMVEHNRRKHRIRRIRIGTGDGHFDPSQVEMRINHGLTQVTAAFLPDGTRAKSADGKELFTFKYPSLELVDHEIVKEFEAGGDEAEGSWLYRIRPAPGATAATARLIQLAPDEAASDEVPQPVGLAPLTPSPAPESPMVAPGAASVDGLAAQLSELTSLHREQTAAMSLRLEEIARHVHAVAQKQQESQAAAQRSPVKQAADASTLEA